LVLSIFRDRFSRVSASFFFPECARWMNSPLSVFCSGLTAFFFSPFFFFFLPRLLSFVHIRSPPLAPHLFRRGGSCFEAEDLLSLTIRPTDFLLSDLAFALLAFIKFTVAGLGEDKVPRVVGDCFVSFPRSGASAPTCLGWPLGFFFVRRRGI